MQDSIFNVSLKIIQLESTIEWPECAGCVDLGSVDFLSQYATYVAASLFSCTKSKELSDPTV
jgi:hypothetical protein